MSAPVPRRRPRGYDPRQHWRQKSLFIPSGLSAKLARASEASGKPEKTIVIEALEAKLTRGANREDDE